MKLYKKIVEKYSPEELAESFVFPNEQKEVERAAALEAFGAWRIQQESERTPINKKMTSLLRLKFLLEDVLKEAGYDQAHDFSYFLQEYINILNIKNKDFAEDIDIAPAELSQIINKHRIPNEKILVRLELHSNKNFPATMWFQLIEKEKLHDLHYNKQLRTTERKHVKTALNFTL